MLKFIKKAAVVSVAAITVSFGLSGYAAAHVVVRPSTVKTSERATFSVSVPNEHDTPVVAVRLVIPEGLKSVRPFAKAGWDISITKAGEGHDASASEIVWTSAGGTVPVDMKDDFLFGAMAPAATAELKWKAYETYQDGLVVGWEQEPSEEEGNKPYSVTKVVTETEAEARLNKVEQAAADADKAADRALYVSIVAAALGLLGVVLASRKK